jgi:two-component system, NtrC family, nitrogen regulation sensor histidine kinase GlnL
MLNNSPTIAKPGHEGNSFENMLQHSVACGVLAVDPDGSIIALTPEAGRSLHLSAVQEQFLSLQTLPSPVQSLIREARAEGRPVYDRPMALSSNDSGMPAMSVSAIPVPRGKHGISVIVVLKDISSLGNMEQNLRRLDRLASVGTLSAGMAHEIKNALVAVKTFVDLLLEKSPDPEFSGTVRRELGRVDSIVGDILKFAAPAQPTFSPVRLHEILDHSLRLVQQRTESQQVSFKREFNASPDSLNGDDHQLEQAFVNLLFNAIEAISSQGALTVSTDLLSDEPQARLHEGGGSPTRLRVKITDTGIGISPENMARIFEPFFTTKQEGTGLGLTVTRRIIEEHSGTVHVESQPGKGTTFIILVPTSLNACSR